jgi:ABC-type Zn uptake system ZnuABC Zn-binding protein ZnuA
MQPVPMRTISALVAILLASLFIFAACADAPAPALTPDPTPGSMPEAAGQAARIGAEDDYDHTLPALNAVDLAGGELLQVAATTNIVADIIAQVGGDAIELTPLIPVGADPHSYTATPQDLRRLNDAHVIFINGLDLEEALLPLLTNLDRDVPIVSVNVGVETVEFEGDHAHNDDHAHDDDHHHDGDDPHTWQSVRNVMHWVSNIETALGALDPANAERYAANALAYLSELEALDAEIRSQVAQIPAENRKLITDHDTYSYYAADYGFQVVGSVIPSFSTLASPSAQELASLQRQVEEEDIQAIFVGTTVNPGLAERLAEDLGIHVVMLYSDSLSDAGGPASSYIEFMRYNTNAIVEALR